MQKHELDFIQKEWEKLWQLPELQALLPKSANWRYWKIKKDKYAFAWTTEPDHKGKFYAFVWRILKNGIWKRKHTVAFGKRHKAKARALKWYNKRKEKLADNQD
jgi:hypothetical protein